MIEVTGPVEPSKAGTDPKNMMSENSHPTGRLMKIRMAIKCRAKDGESEVGPAQPKTSKAVVESGADRKTTTTSTKAVGAGSSEKTSDTPNQQASRRGKKKITTTLAAKTNSKSLTVSKPPVNSLSLS